MNRRPKSFHPSTASVTCQICVREPLLLQHIPIGRGNHPECSSSYMMSVEKRGLASSRKYVHWPPLISTPLVKTWIKKVRKKSLYCLTLWSFAQNIGFFLFETIMWWCQIIVFETFRPPDLQELTAILQLGSTSTLVKPPPNSCVRTRLTHILFQTDSYHWSFLLFPWLCKWAFSQCFWYFQTTFCLQSQLCF